jgi:AraC family transcriptional regulator, transcriptional activator of pobA
MKYGIQADDSLEKTLYHFSFLKDIKVHGIYFNDLTKFLNLYCFIRKQHSHDFYSLILFTGGSGKVLINNESFDVKPGTVCMVAPLQIHSFEEIGTSKGYIFFFHQDYYVEEFSIIRLLRLFSYTSPTATNQFLPALELSEGDYKVLHNAFEAISHEYDIYTPSNSSATIIRSHLNILLLKLTEFYEAKVGKSSNDSVIIHTLSHLVDSYFIREQKLGFYSAAFNISENQLNEICYRHFNTSLKKILQNRLMQEARKLLVSSDLSVSEIAFRLNFEDNSYFNKVFKSKMGLTPKKFRDIHKKLVPQKP